MKKNLWNFEKDLEKFQEKFKISKSKTQAISLNNPLITPLYAPNVANLGFWRIEPKIAF